MRFCYSCGVAVHALCIAPLIEKTGLCICNEGCAFLPISSIDSKKRIHMDLSRSSVHEESIVLPEPVVFADFCKELKNDSTILDFAKSLGAYLDSNQKREDNKDIQQANSLSVVKIQVDKNTVQIAELTRTVHRNENNLSLFELTVGGIHGERMDEVVPISLPFVSF